MTAGAQGGRKQWRQAVAGASDDDDDDQVFIPTGGSGLAGLETEATWRSARGESKGGGCLGGGSDGGGGTKGDFDSDCYVCCSSEGDQEGGGGGNIPR